MLCNRSLSHEASRRMGRARSFRSQPGWPWMGLVVMEVTPGALVHQQSRLDPRIGGRAHDPEGQVRSFPKRMCGLVLSQ